MKGIYKIECTANKKCYIGSSINLEKRKRQHFKNLLNNVHKNQKLQKSYNKYGLSCFTFSILEIIEKSEHLLSKEQFYINTLNPFFNICKTAGSSLGVIRSKKTRDKIRRANIGLKHSDERNKIKSIAQGGNNHWTKSKKFSEDSKNKMSITHKNKYKNGYISPLLGKKVPKEKIEKQIIAISKTVIQLNLKNEFVKEWLNAKETKKFGFNPSHISQCCYNKRKTHKKFKWIFKNNPK